MNKPYNTKELSPYGSAEVIARGVKNAYITEWSLNTTTIDSWDRVEDFPTVVRVGNFVWCWYREYSNHAIWMLIDIVPDPEVESQFGNNIAYPALLNGSSFELQYAAIAENVKTSDGLGSALITDGPYYKLTVNDKIIGNAGGRLNGLTQAGFWSSARSYKELVAERWGETDNVYGGFAISNGSLAPWLTGWGSAQYLLTSANGNDNDYIYGIFAPFATKKQFETLYGKESDWIYRTYDSGHHVMFDQVYNSTRTVAYPDVDSTLTYPFTVEELQPQTLYRDVAADNDGDGVEDIVLATTVAASFIDTSNCDKNPISTAFDNVIDTVKGALNNAYNSTGLLELVKTAEGVKGALDDLLPDVPQILNIQDALKSLDMSDAAAIQAFKEKWSDIVDDIDSLIANFRLPSFDICGTDQIQAEVNEDGTLSKHVPTPIPLINSDPPNVSDINSIDPIQAKENPVTVKEITDGVSRIEAEEELNKFDIAWSELEAEVRVDMLPMADQVFRNKEVFEEYAGRYANKQLDQMDPSKRKIVEDIHREYIPDIAKNMRRKQFLSDARKYFLRYGNIDGLIAIKPEVGSLYTGFPQNSSVVYTQQASDDDEKYFTGLRARIRELPININKINVLYE